MADKETYLPTRQEIAKLTRWAIVAFAARCARRVLPIFAATWPEAPDKHKQAVANAVAVAERVAASVDAVDIAVDTDAASAAFAAKPFSVSAASAAKAASAAFVANTAYASLPNSEAVTIRADFEKLKQACIEQKWNGKTPVPPEFFGPLWPDGEPDWKIILGEHNKE